MTRPVFDRRERVVRAAEGRASRHVTAAQYNVSPSFVVQSTAGAITGLQTTIQRGRVPGGHAYSRTVHADAGR